MTRLITLAFFSLAAFLPKANAQTSLTLDGDFEKGVLHINKVDFTSQSTLDDYQKVLGKPERIEKLGGAERVFAYDRSGISLFLKPNSNIILEVYITYINDGDKKIAKDKFTGTLSLNGNVINSQTTHEQLAKHAKVDIKGAMGMYLSKGKILNLAAYYPNPLSLGQFAFSFYNENK